MSLDTFGLTGATVAHLTPPDRALLFGPWPRLDRHGNVYWWQCLEPRCLFRTDPEARGGDLWHRQQRAHAAAVHPDRDPTTIRHPNSVRGCHLGAPPEDYARGQGVVHDLADLPADEADLADGEQAVLV